MPVRRSLTFAAAALAGTTLTAVPAFAQDATWNGPGTDFNTAANWTPATVPTHRATLAANGPTNVGVSADATLDQLFFDANAQDYTVTIGNAAHVTLNGIGGVGILNDSPDGQIITNNGTLTLNNANVVGGPGGILLNNFASGATASFLLNGTTTLDAQVSVQTQGSGGTGVGAAALGYGATTSFNDSSSADGASLGNTGGGGTGVGTGAGGNGIGGNASTDFNDNAHADGATITNGSGSGTGVAGFGTTGVGIGGSANLGFHDNSHADNATIDNLAVGGTAIGSFDGGSGTGVGGSAVVTFEDAAHADGATIDNIGFGSTAVGGSGRAGTPGDTGTDGGTATAVGVSALVQFTGTAHADHATITSGASSSVSVGGSGGAGGVTGVGGTGGIAVAVGSGVGVVFADATHADGATIAGTAGEGIGVGGTGGTGGATTNGGAGGLSVAVGGSSVISFNDTSHANGATIANRGGAATATGGQGGAGDVGAGNGGVGGATTANGGSAALTFNDTTSAGTATIINTSGAASAIGGHGGDGGGGPGNGGAGGEADATGGVAIVTFNNNASAGSATIFNSVGSATAIGGDGGSGDTGGGGGGGFALATAGDAMIVFNHNSTAGSATIHNGGVGSASVLSGADGAAGGVGAGGTGGSAASVSTLATIQFNDNATGGSAQIDNAGGVVEFNDSSIFGTGVGATLAHIDNTANGQIEFLDSSSLGNGTISNTVGQVTFFGSATAGTGSVTNSANGTVIFTNTSTAGSAHLTNNGGLMVFNTSANAGSATINNASGTLRFDNTTDAVGATLINGATGAIDISGTSAGLRVGSLSGGGTVTLGAQTLQTGFLNQNDTFSGVVSGIGGLTKVGTGTLVLSGTNTYIGLTTISAGTLQIGNGGTTGSVAGDILDNASLVFNRSDLFSYVGVVSGSGSLTKAGTGTLVLLNTNTYTGGTTISGGILQIGGGGTTGSITGDVVDNATLLFNRSDTITFGGVVSGTGSLVKAGTGTLVLTNANTYTGGTVIGGGTLQIGNGGTTGSIAGNVLDNAALAFNRSDTVLFAGVVSGSGTLTQLGSGTLILGGANTYAGNTFVNAGVLQIGNGATSGSVAGNIVDNSLVQFNRTDTVTYGGVISGTGAVIKFGTGTLILTGANTYTGNTTVANGTLELNGSITSNTNVFASGRLGGTGTVTGAVNNQGTIAAGSVANPLGTLHVTGNVTFAAGSFLIPTLNAAGATSLLQAGTITIASGTVRPQVTGTGVFGFQTDYHIAIGTGGLTGTFNGVVDESLLPAFLDASLTYTATDAILRIRRNSSNFAATAGLTPNQLALSTALDGAVTANNPLVFSTYLTTYNTLLFAPSGAALQADLDQLSGDALTLVPLVAQAAAGRFADRLTDYTWSNSSNLWGLVAYADENGHGDGNGPGFNANGLEVQLGFATSLGSDTRLGLSAGWVNGDADARNRVASANVDTWSVGAELRHDFAGFYLSGQATYSWHNVDTRRALLLGGTASASFNATTWTASAEAGAVFHSGHLNIEPFISYRHASTGQDGYTESGPVGILDVAPQDYDTDRVGIGLRLANRDPAATVRPYVSIRYERAFGDEVAALDNDLPGLPTFRVVSTRLGKDVISGTLGLEAQVSQGLSLFVGGGGRWRNHEHDLQANGGLRIRF